MKKGELVTDAAYDRLISLTGQIESQMYIYGKDLWHLISEQITIHIPDLGLIGIEINGANSIERLLSVDFYEQVDDDWKHCWNFRCNACTPDILRTNIVSNLMLLKTRREKDLRNQKRRKYRRGEPIRSLDELVQQDLVYWREKITPRGWFLSWQLKMTLDALKRGDIYYAIRKEDDNG